MESRMHVDLSGRTTNLLSRATHARICTQFARCQASKEMVWFQCEGCGDTLKKPKLGPHMSSCRSTHFTCIDCSVTFDRNSVQARASVTI